MSVFDRLPHEALDDLLDGSPSDEVVGTPLAAYIAELRDDARSTTPAPSPELSVLLAEGLEPAAVRAGADRASDEGARRGLFTWRRRARVLGRVLVTKFAALGILGKAAAAGAAVTVAASGAGAAGVLPEPAQHEFNEVVGREVPEAPAEAGDQSGAADDDSGAEAGTPTETPADTSTTDPLDTDVSDDATGRSDDEPGVDGEDVAEDASDGASGAPEDRPAETAPKGRPADPGRGDEAVEEAPTEATPDDVPPNETPSPREGRNDDAAADQGDSGRSPDPASGPPAAGGSRD